MPEGGTQQHQLGGGGGEKSPAARFAGGLGHRGGDRHLSPTTCLSRVDLPTFARPIRATKPEREAIGSVLSIMPARRQLVFAYAQQ